MSYPIDPQATAAMPRLTVAILARDAEDRIVSTIQSVQAIADEILVGDTGSTDQTVQIAEQMSAKVVSIPWTDDFSAARNACFAHASGDWVLWLDAGETLDPQDATELRQLISSQTERNKAFMMLVKLPPETKNVAGEQVGKIRLVPRIEGIRFEGRVAESMYASLNASSITVDAIPHRIHRSEYDLRPDVKLRKANRDLELSQRAINESGPSAQMLLVRGEALGAIGNREEARLSFQQARQLAEPESREMLESFYGELTTYDGLPEAQTQQLQVCLQAIESFSLDVQLLCAMGSYLQGQGRFDLATRAYQTAYQFGQIHPEIWHIGDIHEVAALCLCLALQVEKNDEGARQVLEEVVGRGNPSQRVVQQLIEFHVRAGRRAEALELVDQLPADFPHPDCFRSAIRGACLATEQNWISAKAYLQTAFNAGCREPLCFRWYSVALLSLSDLETLAAVLDVWADVAPDSPEVAQFRAAMASPEQLSAAAPQAAVAMETQGEATGRTMRIDSAESAMSPPAAAETAAPSITPTRPN